jgi:hypothetical protein
VQEVGVDRGDRLLDLHADACANAALDLHVVTRRGFTG